MRIMKMLVKKEIMDILRDKKTLIMMVVVPLLLYPAILIGTVLFTNYYMQSQEEKTYLVGVEATAAELAKELETLYLDEEDQLEWKLSFVYEDPQTADIWFACIQEQSGQQVTISYNSTVQDSMYARNALRDLLDIYKERLVTENLASQGLSQEFLQPIRYESEDLASDSESMGMGIGGSIGMLLVITILMGALYPSIDATTGEKERGTLETLLTLPVSNFQMIMSKYIAVALFACVTALISLLSLGGSVWMMMLSSVDTFEGFSQLSAGTLFIWIPVLLAALITTALLITAISMCFCIFAKSFKEANNYITPVLMIIMFISMIGMIPSIQLDYRMALIPIANVSLLIKQIMAQQAQLGLAGLAIGVNFGYSILVIWILGKMYDSEDILFQDGFRSFRIFEKRSDIKKGTIADIGDIILILAVVLLLMLYVGSAVSARSIMGGVYVQQIIILVTPLLAVWYLKSDARELFALHRPHARHLLGAFFLYIAVYACNLLISSLLAWLLPESVKNLDRTFDLIFQQPIALVVVAIAVLPAIGEELLFRGFLFGSLRSKHRIWTAILLSAGIFGLFHMSVVKFLQTSLLGALFAYLIAGTGSIFITMLLHFLNNLLSVVASYYPQAIEKVLPVLFAERFTGMQIVMIAAVAILCGAAGLFLLKKQEPIH